jgi:lysophospholipase L1-like esterase
MWKFKKYRIIAVSLIVFMFCMMTVLQNYTYGGRKIVMFGDSLMQNLMKVDQDNTPFILPLIKSLPDARNTSFIKRAISGNHLLDDGSNSYGLARFQQDALADPLVSHVIVLIGANDLVSPGTKSNPSAPPMSAQKMIDGYKQLISMTHERGIKIIGATLLPFKGAYADSELIQKSPGYLWKDKERERQAINTWIRKNSDFDSIIDFDAAVRDPSDPGRILPLLDNDHTHPNDEGYRRMAEAITPNILKVSFWWSFKKILGPSKIPSRLAGNSWWVYAFAFDDQARQAELGWRAIKLNRLMNIPPQVTFDQRMNIVRDFIADNSERKIDDDFYSYWADMPYILSMLMRRGHDFKTYKPHLECSTRSAVMYALLQAMGVDTKVVVVYPDNTKISHTYVEVYNPDRQAWEIQDPYIDAYWVFKTTHAKASTEDMLRHNVMNTFIPCRSEQDCGYNELSRSVASYFSLASVLDIKNRQGNIIVNTSRIDSHQFSKFYKSRKPYCKILKNGCEQEVLEVTTQEEKK